MAQRFEPVLKTLSDARVRYLVVGGVAVVFHGHLRTTGDLDLEDVAVLEALARGDDDD